METNFELKNVTESIRENKETKEFILNFSDKFDEKSITLTGSGNLKTALKI